MVGPQPERPWGSVLSPSFLMHPPPQSLTSLACRTRRDHPAPGCREPVLHPLGAGPCSRRPPWACLTTGPGPAELLTRLLWR